MDTIVDKLNNVYPNVNQFYMTGLVTMPMIIIEVILMRSMYINKKLNAALLSGVLLHLLVLFSAVSERQFLRGMIPHHAAVILMSKNCSKRLSQIREKKLHK